MGTAVEAGRLERYEAALNNPAGTGRRFAGGRCGFHCAARVSFDPREEGDIVAANTEIATQVADACLECGVGLLVYVSSIAAIGRTGSGN
ncbi:MAG: NAD-dependent epimerase/dehydratase family protein [Alistipes indistinctus]